ncbi:tRNA (N6-isopentenyl adenosine(37)-C2)-methylthiotransferase MiaB [Kurthia sibirica]|uniref:tRNA-2-methylthio-N(6)-dimethylallyladenosine synthase n=1 Tax=Kurthia sibirica TaxID=202750 RepID=A0A2U3AR39_9BACL|nr:tRNA (N6-isopentenyl adenosine(37)-C2)-methylthiotransferase MiaB [Kurthia sibirica]PWI26966.1 tRNA (N6-isopentenyl adenosine(37)-C2)-methylthiotransferase MiaB [Kurthia sibirica]GEK32487.1 tRNA-2-methylthio-N(6)-dimethylallyladenosine synthase [Kurthia sibirica]
MNEEQRLANNQIIPVKPIENKDYSRFFQATPSLKEAKKRGKETIQYHADFKIDERFAQMGNNRKFYIRTYGCQMNEHDTEVMAGIFEQLGYEATDDVSQANVILMNTCAIRENAENRVFGELGHFKALKRHNPDVLIGVCGCMSQEEAVVNKILKTYNQVDLVFGTHNIHRLPELLHEAYMSKAMVIDVWSKEGDIIENLPKTRKGQTKAWVNIMYGCDKFCTYCIVPYTRGKERSRLPKDIITEVRELAAAGYKEITLLGQNVNAYGKDLPGSTIGLGELMNELRKIDLPRIRFTTSHPRDFDDYLIEVLAKKGNLVEHIHLPVQSGSNGMLKIMARKYTRESYLALVKKIRQAIPDVALTTDLIVGFPNETEAQFEETLSLYREVGFEMAFTYIYSPREGTPAAAMQDNIPMDVKKIRLQKLNALVGEYCEAAMKQFENQIVEVLVEGESKRNKNVLAGYTRKNKLVNFEAPREVIGQLVSVRITEAKQYSLTGEFLEIVAGLEVNNQ